MMAQLDEFLVNVQNMGPLDLLDLVILVALFCGIYRVIRGTRAVNLVRGLLVLLVVFFLAKFLKLHYMSAILEKFMYFFGAASAVIFAPEIRRGLERLGNFNLIHTGSILSEDEIDSVLSSIRNATGNLSRRKVGALIVFEQGSQLKEIAETGIVLDAVVSSGLLINIFEKNTPLHDGAILIRGNRIVAATCYLPLTEQELTKELGTRHRAALGLSEQSDALVVVVSEQTGDISVARNGELLRYLKPNDVQALLVETLYRKVSRTVLMQIVEKCFK